MVFFSPDTDVLVLVIANYDLVLKNTSISMASGVMRIEPIWRAIGAERANALPAFHAFTGADNTGRFSHIGKATWLELYIKPNSVIRSLRMLSAEKELTETMFATLASFISAAYSSKGIYVKTMLSLQNRLFFCQMFLQNKKLILN